MDIHTCYIYKIVCKDPCVDDIYVGSTVDMKKRKNRHKRDCHNPDRINHNYKLYEFIRFHDGFDNWKMILLEELHCSKKERYEKEREYIELLNATLNEYRPIITLEERKEKHRIWCNNNKEKLNKINRQYRQNNKEKIKERKRIYRENNREKERERKRIYRENNKEKIKERHLIWRNNNKEKITCECGSVISKYKKNDHLKSKKHIKFIENNIS